MHLCQHASPWQLNVPSSVRQLVAIHIGKFPDSMAAGYFPWFHVKSFEKKTAVAKNRLNSNRLNRISNRAMQYYTIKKKLWLSNALLMKFIAWSVWKNEEANYRWPIEKRTTRNSGTERPETALKEKFGVITTKIAGTRANGRLSQPGTESEQFNQTRVKYFLDSLTCDRSYSILDLTSTRTVHKPKGCHKFIKMALSEPSSNPERVRQLSRAGNMTQGRHLIHD